MQVQDLFEAHWADVHAVDQAYVRDQRMGEDTYRIPSIASGWRMFRAGFEAKDGELLCFTGQISNENARNSIYAINMNLPIGSGFVGAGTDFAGESGGGVVKMTSPGAKTSSQTQRSAGKLKVPRESLVGQQRGLSRVISYSEPFYTMECECGKRYSAGFKRVSHTTFTGRCVACTKARASALGKKNVAVQMANAKVCSHGYSICVRCAFPTLEVALKSVGR